MRIDVVSIFPEYLAPLELSLIGKARQDGLLDLKVHDLRDFTTDRHRTVDDTPYGGGAGMVMKPEPWGEATDPDGTLKQIVEKPKGLSAPGRCRQACPDRPVAGGGALHPGHRARTGGGRPAGVRLRALRGHR